MANFTGTDLREDAEFYSEVTLTDSEAVKVVNRGLDRLGTLGLAYGEEEFTIDGTTVDVFQSMTDDIIGIIQVLDENNNSFERWEYEQDGSIKFSEEGTYYVIYRKIPDNITAIADTIDLKGTYEEPLTKHFEGFVKLKYNDTSPDGTRLMQEFERLAAVSFNTLIQSRIPAEIRASEFMSGMMAGQQTQQRGQ